MQDFKQGSDQQLFTDYFSLDEDSSRSDIFSLWNSDLALIFLIGNLRQSKMALCVTKIAFDIRKNMKVERFGFSNAKIIDFFTYYLRKQKLKSTFFFVCLTWVCL